MKNLWVPLALSVASISGLLIGHVSGRMSAAREFSTVASSSPLPRAGQAGACGSKVQGILNLVNNLYVDAVDVDSLEETFIPEMLKKLDPHSTYIPRAEVEHAASELKSNFAGIGVTFTIIQDTVNIESVVSGGPSDNLGLLPGDKIIKVNGRDFVGRMINNQVVMDSLRGVLGTVVDVTVRKRSGDNVDYSITRGIIPLNSVDVAYEIADGVGYIKIDRFAENTYHEMIAALAKLRADKCSQVIVDLRSNSGGYLNVVSAMCNEFLEKGDLIVYTEGAHYARTNTVADGTGSCKDLQVVVLIDQYSASASEIFAGAMQDNDRGIIIGRRSFGKGLVQREIPLPDMSSIRLTVERYHTPSGRCIQRSYAKGTEDYYDNLHQRLEQGEYFSADSIKADTSNVFYTKKGRPVYGGGGIIPDIFVPYDTTSASQYLYQLRARRIIHDYAIKYADEHREELKGLSADALIRNLLRMSFMDDMVAFASRKGLKPASLDKSEKAVIENEVRAYIGRAMLNADVFYPILNTMDETISVALKQLGAKSKY